MTCRATHTSQFFNATVIATSRIQVEDSYRHLVPTAFIERNKRVNNGDMSAKNNDGAVVGEWSNEPSHS